MTRFSFLGALALARGFVVPHDFEKKVEPALKQLADFDPDMLGLLETAVDMESENIGENTAFLQMRGPDIDAALKAAAQSGDVQGIIASLAPLLANVKSHDKDKFQDVVGVIGRLSKKKPAMQAPSPDAGPLNMKKHASFLQMVSTPEMQSRLAAFQPIFQKVRNMDEERFEQLQQVIRSELPTELPAVAGESFLQEAGHSRRASRTRSQRVSHTPGGGLSSHLVSQIRTLEEAMANVHSMDPKAASILNSVLSLVSESAAKKAAFLQLDPMVEEQRLSRLGPILLKLQKIDGKTFGGLAKLVGVAKDQAATKVVG